MVIRSKHNRRCVRTIMSDPVKSKSEYRSETREKLAGLPESYISEASAAIALNALGIKEMKGAKTVLAYYSVGKEPGTLALISKLLAEGKTVCLPLCTDLGEDGRRMEDAPASEAMEARAIKSFDDLEAGAYGIPEPKKGTKAVPPDKIDLIILPCVTCDRSCNRLGHGAGYYDKYLKGVRPDCFTMALCYEKVLADQLPAEEHDVPVDAVITEETVYRWRRQ